MLTYNIVYLWQLALLSSIVKDECVNRSVFSLTAANEYFHDSDRVELFLMSHVTVPVVN